MSQSRAYHFESCLQDIALVILQSFSNNSQRTIRVSHALVNVHAIQSSTVLSMSFQHGIRASSSDGSSSRHNILGSDNYASWRDRMTTSLAVHEVWSMVTEQSRQFQSHFETSQILPTLIRQQSTQQLLSWRRTWKISVSPPAIFFTRSLTVRCTTFGRSLLMPCRSGTSFGKNLIGRRRWKLRRRTSC